MSKPLQPQVHFRPEGQWINDPNGPIYVNGEYHLFYQYNPFADYWETMHWGHAKSKDLVHWEHLPIALYPSNELGEKHCFSGCTVMEGDRPAILYTSIGFDEARGHTSGAQQWLAYGSSDLMEWRKYEGNPVLSNATNEGRTITEWRDPFVWQEDGVWYMVCGGSYEGRGCAVLYRTVGAELTAWEFVSIVAVGEDRIWECPNLFRLGDRWVLIYSPDLNESPVRFQIGTMTGEWRFQAESEGVLDYGGREGYYAPTSFVDGTGRRIQFGWMPELARGDYKGIAGWSGVQALPRELRLTADRRLQVVPIPELASLRDRHLRLEAMPLEGGAVETGVRGDMLELHAVFHAAPDAVPFGLVLLRSAGGEEETRLIVDRRAGRIALDRSRSSLYEGVRRTEREMPLEEPADGLVSLRVYLDRSTIEVFLNDASVLSARVYPSLDTAKQVSLFSDAPIGSADSGVRLMRFDAWTLAPVWPKSL